jgi:hypothetical protein
MSRISEEHESESGLVSIRISREISKMSRRRECEISLDIARLETRGPHLGSAPCIVFLCCFPVFVCQ